MGNIQKYLTIDERVEVYNSGITLYNLESGEENDFDDEQELIEFLKSR
jgi:hypothetical protein